MISITFARTADLPSVYNLHLQTLGADSAASASSKFRAACSDDDVMHLVAHEEDRVVGSIQLRRASLDGIGCDATQKISFLGPLVTDSYYQGMGLGSKLMAYGLSLLRKEGYIMVFLVGDDVYYSRFGFRSVRPMNIALPENQDGDRLMFKMLGRPYVLPMYARLSPYSISEISPSLSDEGVISSIKEERPWREHVT